MWDHVHTSPLSFHASRLPPWRKRDDTIDLVKVLDSKTQESSHCHDKFLSSNCSVSQKVANPTYGSQTIHVVRSVRCPHTGVDFDIKNYTGRACLITKGYVCVFVCFSTTFNSQFGPDDRKISDRLRSICFSTGVPPTNVLRQRQNVRWSLQSLIT